MPMSKAWTVILHGFFTFNIEHQVGSQGKPIAIFIYIYTYENHIPNFINFL